MAASSKPTTSTQGILHTARAAGAFTLRRMAPHDGVAHLVERYWAVQWDLGTRTHTQRVLPHPCVNLVFEPEPFVYGMAPGVDARLLSGAGGVLGVKFRPGMFHAYHPVPAATLLGKRVPAADIFGPSISALARTLTGSVDADAARLDAYFLDRVVALDDTARLVTAAVSRMLQAPPGARVEDVALALGIHVRSLQRHLAQRVGVTPKWMLSRYRVHEAAQRLEEGPVRDWAALALELGYCDQAHFIHDFGAALGQTPAQYAREALFSDDTEPPQDRAAAASPSARAETAAGLR